ncbi:MAG: helix-turn-helix domain-containing protein [Actinomycetota bacterium]
MATLTLTEGRTPNLRIVITDWESLPLMLTYEEVAQVVRCGEDAIREAVALKQLSPIKFGKRITRFERSDIRAYCERRTAAARDAA